MKVLELFGGIGACTQALKRLGIDVEIADYVEIDKYAVKSYNAINGTNFEPQDITKWDKDIDVDLIMHGSPCQDISLAGQQAGADEGSGTRSSLMYETIRIVNKLKPKYIIWENVKNLISKKHRHNFDKYLEALSKQGYKNYWQVLNAKDYGIPQNRERVFTISIRNDIDKGYEFPPKQELKLRLKDLLEDEVDEKYYLSEKMNRFFMHNEQVQKEKGNGFRFGVSDGNIIAKAVTTRAGSRMDDNFIQYNNQRANQTIENHKEEIKENSFLDCYNNKVLNDGTTPTITSRISASNNSFIAIKNATKKGYDEATEGDSIDLTYPKGVIVVGNYMPSNHEASRIVDNTGLAPTVKENHGTVTATIVKDNNRNAKHQQDLLQSDEGICRTIPAGTHASTPHLLKTITTNEGKLKIRKLTPKECWRLMGFSDEAFDKASQVNSNTQLYKQAGNSIVVNVLEAIFKELLGGKNEEETI